MGEGFPFLDLVFERYSFGKSPNGECGFLGAYGIFQDLYELFADLAKILRR